MNVDPVLLLESPVEVLFERPGLLGSNLPAPLAAAYGGQLGFGTPRLFANFVASVDGVVALPSTGESGQIISQHSDADRFVMGLLRACAEAVIVGADTFRHASGHLWRPDAIYPAAAALFAETRSRLGLPPYPTLVLVTGSGIVDTAQPALRDAIIVTTPDGRERLRAHAQSSARVLRVFTVESSRIRLADVIAWLHQEGLRVLLSEGGPSLVAGFVAEGLLDELFVTISPVLFGRYANDGRKSLIDGIDLAGASLELLSARRHRSHLFMRYAVIGSPEHAR